ncbi:nicotinamide riboside transporter PnuC [Wenyingzhuangia sp.]|uniref:nicotinamide riboside transporter PnuC n=1 Tax=Wenyingzhuangia sp. TaxID=1964193 RepID=UPI00321B1F49
MNHIFNFFLSAYQDTSTGDVLLEAVAFVFGIASVVYSKKEDILVYPVGLVATVITVYLLYKAQYFGDMMMNFYYSAMSIYGWWNWSRKKNNKTIVPISRTTSTEKRIGVFMVLITMFITSIVYVYFGYDLKPENYIDVFTSGIFFTAMWYMANKKIENWMLWIFADLITVPLYAYRGLGMLSLQYLIFTILAVQGYLAWRKNLNNTQAI